jgi:hypothetical protein
VILVIYKKYDANALTIRSLNQSYGTLRTHVGIIP